MRISTFVLAAHVLVFSATILCALAAPFIAFFYPQFFSLPILVALYGAALLLPLLWRFFGGCPFTVWENFFLSENDVERGTRDHASSTMRTAGSGFDL